MAKLYIVATPIGNLQDITLRALNVLKKVDLILCEDTRQSKKLLDHYQIKKPLLSYHQHSKIKRINQIIEFLKKGKNLALISDAGTPGISDPGNELIKKVLERVSENVEIVPIPGPSALITCASISGFPMDRFLFLGFPPKKKKRKKFFQNLINCQYPVIFYESPYRIKKTLKEIFFLLKGKPKKVVVCKELTKKFEKIFRGDIEKVIKEIEKEKLKGEFVIILNNK